MRWAVCLSATVMCALLLLAAPAHAAFPGKNGKIALRSGYDVLIVNPDGSGEATLAAVTCCGTGAPGWSADGQKLVFEGIDPDPNSYGIGVEVINADGSGRTLVDDASHNGYPRAGWSPDSGKVIYSWYSCPAIGDCLQSVNTVNPDGTGRASLTGYAGWGNPAWSPDGGKIALESVVGNGIFTVNPDGSNETRLSTGADHHPDWSPDGSKIVFYRTSPKAEIWVMNADGSGQTPLKADSYSNGGPVFSPDGSKIAFASNRDGPDYHIYTMNADGTGVTRVSTARGNSPDWQPLPITGYPRPKGATPFQTYLTVAYDACPSGSGNRQHGPPLAVLSCSPAVQSSNYLTVGTLDSNQNPAKSVGQVRIDVKPGNPSTPADEADLKLFVSIKDVRLKDLSDYAGELSLQSSRRITDKDNTPNPSGPGPATTNEIPFAATIPCSPSADTTIGSLCSLTTTADTLVPGQVKEEVRSIWQLSQLEVYDGGADSDADTPTDNTLFMNEGIFVP